MAIKRENRKGKVFHLPLGMLMLKCLLKTVKLDILVLREITYERNWVRNIYFRLKRIAWDPTKAEYLRIKERKKA